MRLRKLYGLGRKRVACKDTGIDPGANHALINPDVNKYIYVKEHIRHRAILLLHRTLSLAIII